MEHRITLITFDQRLSRIEMTGFRGAVASLFPDETIYHNHEGDSLIYRYPAIQYKFIEGRVSIVGIDEGAESIEKHFPLRQKFSFIINGEPVEMTVTEKKTTFYVPESQESAENYYFIKNWMPLNQENHVRYIQSETISEKIALLDSILSANILSLFSGFGYFSEHKSKANILEIVSSDIVKYKGNDMQTFDIRFKCNAKLPEFCGLGKGASRGFGIIYQSHPRSNSTRK